MAVKFSQFTSTTPNSNIYFAGYNSVLGTNVQVSYTDLAASISPGTGTTNYVSKWTSSTALGNSLIQDDGSNVGIGTAPTAIGLFRVLSINSSTGSILDLLRNGTSQMQIQVTSGVNAFAGQTNLPMAFSTNGSNRMQIFGSTGNISIGYGGSPTDAGYKVDLSGTLRSTGDANINGLTVGKGGGSVSENTAIGVSALASNTTANTQTAVGYLAGNANTVSNHNTFIGARSGVVTTAGENTFVGARSGFSHTIGVKNTFLGTFAGYDITSGLNNTLVGYNTGGGITTGNYNTIIGVVTSGLSSSLSNTIILADGQGNQRLYINSSGNVGIGTTSPTTKITMFGQNPMFRVQGDGVSYYGGIDFYSSVSGSNRLNGSITQYDGNGLYIAAGTGMRLTFTINNGTEGMRLTSAGRLLIGTTTESTYLLDVNGTTRISGTELRLDNGTTGTLNIYSNTPSIQFFSADPTGYRFYRSGTGMFWNSSGSICTQIGGNDAYTLNASTGHIWRTALSGGAALARLTTGGNLIVGGTTDAGYRVDVQGTFRVSSTTANVEQALFTGSASPYIRSGIWGVIGMHNASQATFVGNNAYPSDAGNQSWTRIGGAGSLIGWINIGEAGMFFASGINAATGSSRNDSKMALFPSGNFGVGNGVTDISSAILSATSTTKGFLPPVMTGAQAELIGTPAAGLLVYVNNGNGATITSIGWWGYNGTTWVKLN